MQIVDYPFRVPSNYSIPKPALPIIIINPDNGFEVRTWGLIDTGADASAIPEFTAITLGHNICAVKAEMHVGVGGSVKAYHHKCRIDILASTPDGIVSNEVLTSISKKIAVILGLHTVILGEDDFLKKYILKIDYPNKTFSIYTPQRKKH